MAGNNEMNEQIKNILLAIIACASHASLLGLAFDSFSHLKAHPSDVPFEMLVVTSCLASILLSLVSAFIMFAVVKHKVTPSNKLDDAAFALRWTLVAASFSPVGALVASLLASPFLFAAVFTAPIGAVVPYIFITSQALQVNE